VVDSSNTQIFVIAASKESESLESKFNIMNAKVFNITPDVWFVAYAGTARDLAESLGIRKGEHGTGVVCPISSYSGRASSDLWEWFKVNWPSA
jgi:hypothetical protein